jgi:regulator of sigma E protease
MNSHYISQVFHCKVDLFMIVSLFYIFLAVLGLSFLIFIHELGHYWMARHVGMRVEVFAIGFGRPIYSWTRNGVRWQIGWLPFGGYVKIAGQDLEGDKDPYQVPDGFFGKPPFDRIKVAFMGPFVNLVFAFLIFDVIWMSGGREKDFVDYTHVIGWVDQQSELYASGIRPGDEITGYNGAPYHGAKDNLYAPMLSGDIVQVNGFKVDPQNGEKKPFEYTVKTYPHPNSLEKEVKTSGILNPANYIIYDKLSNGLENPLPEGSPMQDSGIQSGDRIVWVDGETIFSSSQLAHILNDNKALLTVVRGNETLLRRVPRVEIMELKIDPSFKEEVVDWQYEAQLNGTKIQKLKIIPYDLTNSCQVENSLKFIDKEKQEDTFPKHLFSDLDAPLQPGDKIVAIDGTPVTFSYQLLAHLQQHYVNVIVERNPLNYAKTSWKTADADFDRSVHWKDLNAIVQTIGTEAPLKSEGSMQLLKPVLPKRRSEFTLSPEKQAWLATELLEQKKEIEEIEDPEKRAQAFHHLQSKEQQLLLGLPLIHDRKVTYNPGPFRMFEDVFTEIWQTLVALLSGMLNPKWMSGPIGIVQVVHNTWMVSVKEAFYWIGAISLNLGVINLLPIPVLDGGTILITLLEMITRRRFSPKTLEKIVIPFAVLLIGFFVYLTFNDLSRLYHDMGHIFGGFWRK